MKKKLFLIIVSVIIITGLVGALAVYFSSRGVQAGEEEEFVPSAAQVDVNDLKDAKITIYFENRSNSVMPDVLAAVNEKLHSELKTELAFEMIAENPERYMAKIQEDIAAGKPCDAFFYSSNFPVSLRLMAKDGLARDLTEDLTRYAPDYIGKFSVDEIEAISMDGKIYAVPYRIPTAGRKCVLVRDDLMTRYKIPEIKSYEDYEVYLAAVKKNVPDLIPMDYWDTTLGLFSEANGYVVLNYELGLVYKWDDPSMKVMAWEQAPEFAEGIRRIKSWYDKGYLIKNVGIAQIDERIITGGRWMSFIGNWGDEFYYNSLLASDGIKDFKYKAYPLHVGISARNSPSESALVINAKSAQADRVLMFINWLQSGQENYDLLMYGVEGRNYTDMGDYIVPTGVTGEEDSFFNWGWKAPFRNIEYERVNFTGLKEEVAGYNKVIEEKTKFPPSTGFIPDFSAVSDLVTPRGTDNAKLDRKVFKGILRENDVDDFIKDQKENGVQRIIDEIQSQLDEFRRNK
jgi:putative aldouronate transport system substrate-binding protein